METDPEYCDEVYHRMRVEEDRVRALSEKQRALIPQEAQLMELLDRAHRVHEERVAAGRCFVPAAS